MKRVIKQPVSEQQAEAWLRHLKKSYLACRAWGHSWPHIEDPKHRRFFELVYDNNAGEKVLYCTCMKCGRMRYTISGLNSPIFPAAWRVYRMKDAATNRAYAAPYGAMKHLRGVNTFRNESVRRYEEEVGHYADAEKIVMGFEQHDYS